MRWGRSIGHHRALSVLSRRRQLSDMTCGRTVHVSSAGKFCLNRVVPLLQRRAADERKRQKPLIGMIAHSTVLNETSSSLNSLPSLLPFTSSRLASRFSKTFLSRVWTSCVARCTAGWQVSAEFWNSLSYLEKIYVPARRRWRSYRRSSRREKLRSMRDISRKRHRRRNRGTGGARWSI